MNNFVLRKLRSQGPALVLPVIIFFMAWLLIMMVAKEDEVIPEPEKNKLQSLISYVWKEEPRPVEEPKCAVCRIVKKYFK